MAKSAPLSKTPGKPEIEYFISALNDSSQRSRTMLIGIIFASILSSIALINSLRTDWNWFKSRIEVRKTAMEWFVFPEEEQNQKVEIIIRDSSQQSEIRIADESQVQGYKSITEFAKALEESALMKGMPYIPAPMLPSLIRDSCDTGPVPDWLHKPLNDILPDWVSIKPYSLDTDPSRFPSLEQRKHLYKNLAKATGFINKYDFRSRKSLEYTFDNLIESQYENLSLVRIPILGIAFDINNLGFISGVIFLSLLTLLYLSMVREGRNLKTLFTHGWLDKNIDDRRLYELLSMYQVLTVPLKLYSPDKTYDKVARAFIYGIFWLPVGILFLIFLYDLDTYDVGTSLNPFLAFITTASTLLMLLAVFVVVSKITERQIRIDRQWDNQYYRLNLEKLFNLEPNDADINVWTTPEQVRINWANTVEEAKRLRLENREISEIHSVGLLEKFIDDCYDDDEEKLGDSKKEQVEPYWEHLRKWFENNKAKSTRHEFRKSLKDLMNGSFEYPESV